MILDVLEKTSAKSEHCKVHLKCHFLSTGSKCLEKCVASDYVTLPDSEGNSLGTNVGHATGTGSVSTLPLPFPGVLATQRDS